MFLMSIIPLALLFFINQHVFMLQLSSKIRTAANWHQLTQLTRCVAYKMLNRFKFHPPLRLLVFGYGVSDDIVVVKNQLHWMRALLLYCSVLYVPCFDCVARREIPPDEYEYVLRKIHHTRQNAVADSKRNGKFRQMFRLFPWKQHSKS